MPQNTTEFELKLFFNNPLFGVFFMQTEQAVQWVKGASNTEELDAIFYSMAAESEQLRAPFRQ